MTLPKRTARTDDFEHDLRYTVSVREAWLCIGYFVAFATTMVVVAWSFAGHRDPADTTYILGFPDWFFWTGIVVVGIFSIVVPYAMIRFLFTEVDLEPQPSNDANAGGERR